MEHIVYVFEGYRLDAGRRQLSSSGGVVVPLNSRAMEALVMLVSRAGELVSKRELLEGVWPSAVVEENNINQCVLAIRKALGEAAGTNRFIMTVPGRGYRFVAPVMVQKREALDDPAEQIAPTSHLRLSARRAMAAAAILMALLSGIGGLYLRHGFERPAGAVDPADLIVQLRRSDEGVAGPAAALLLDCLRQRPDLHLQIEVHVVGAQSTPPLWSGQFIAGADDVASGDARRGSDHNACRSLANPP